MECESPPLRLTAMNATLSTAAAIVFASVWAAMRRSRRPAPPRAPAVITASARIETPVPRLAGRNAAEIVAAMQEFRRGQRPGTVMDRIAKGFTDDEIRAIAAWYAAQK